MSKYSFDPTYFSRIQKFHELFGMILRQNWTSNVTSFKKSKIWHYFSLVMNVFNHSWKIVLGKKERKNPNISMILNWNILVGFFLSNWIFFCWKRSKILKLVKNHLKRAHFHIHIRCTLFPNYAPNLEMVMEIR